ncbi:MAG TPA: cupin domain-containing protein [Myxococcales bacterium]|nr:cupin domain-containing protein [Myxococcales bacterium]
MNKTSLLECEAQVTEQGDFAFRRKRLGAAAGAKGIGASWFEIQPGKKAFPHHFHLANEEAVFVLEGEGVLRLGDEEHRLRAGDYVAFPPGPPGHQIVNRGTVPLRYLALSTMREPEVAVYPDSKKIGVLSRTHGLTSVHRQDASVDYYEGEK